MAYAGTILKKYCKTQNGWDSNDTMVGWFVCMFLRSG